VTRRRSNPRSTPRADGRSTPTRCRRSWVQGRDGLGVTLFTCYVFCSGPRLLPCAAWRCRTCGSRAPA
jgi:hypothetical protein